MFKNNLASGALLVVSSKLLAGKVFGAPGPSEKTQLLKLTQNYMITTAEISKNAFISVMTDRLLQIAQSADAQSYTSIYAYLNKRDLDELLPQNLWDSRYCGIESEMVNLLEGRISPEIFVRHYWSPNMKQDIGRVRKAIDILADQLV
jgi:hypothetical protein